MCVMSHTTARHMCLHATMVSGVYSSPVTVNNGLGCNIMPFASELDICILHYRQEA